MPYPVPARATLLRIVVIALVLPGFSPGTAQAQAPLGGFLDFNGYYDTRSFSTLTVNLLSNLPSGFQYFSLTNFSGAIDADPAGDLGAFYSEQHLRWSPSASVPFDLTALWNLKSGDENDVVRFGVRWRPGSTGGVGPILRRLRLSYTLTFHAAKLTYAPTGGWQPQLEHAYRWDLVPGRVYLGGFLDHDLQLGGDDTLPRSRIVTEHQLGYQLVPGLHAVLEARLNQRMGPDDDLGLGFGFEYQVPFVFAR